MKAEYRFMIKVLGNERSMWIDASEGIGGILKLFMILDTELCREGVEAPATIEELFRKGIDREGTADNIT